VRFLFNAEIKKTDAEGQTSSTPGAGVRLDASSAAAAAMAGGATGGLGQPRRPTALTYSAPSEDGSVSERRVSGDGTPLSGSTPQRSGNRAERRKAGRTGR
jgi:preprotein translocase subunit SecA